ncbi:MAG: tRNA lysidine(34) synthetase TilS [Acidimicrobiales bacterium]|nr:tRNA lysidine(34) synthetase TilS [Acidimicrobiales bacterium]
MDSGDEATVASLLERTTFPDPSRPVTCAVSGGPDSLALLVLACASGRDVTAVHVDHGLREGSAGEADVVAEAARRFGAAFRSVSVEVGDGPNLEARAREARYAVLPTDVCTGHTADDRAETMILNLLRGAGPAGLGALRPGVRHPILALRRAETVALCDRLGLRPVTDPSNADPRHRRNRVRREVLPLLADVAGRDVVPVLARQGDLFAELDEDLVAAAVDVDPTDATALRTVSRAVARTAVRLWLIESGVGDGHPPDSGAVQRVLDVAAGDVRATEVAGGWRVARTAGRLRLEPPAQPA